MLRNLSRYLLFALPVLLGLGCTSAGSATPTVPAPPTPQWQATIEAFEEQIEQLEGMDEDPVPEVYGMWMTEDDDPGKTSQILVFTADSMYRVETFEPLAPSQEPFARETYYEILDHDVSSGHMAVRIRWIRVNGEFGGFDSPSALFAYRVEDGVLRLAQGSFDEGLYPEELDPIEYYRR